MERPALALALLGAWLAAITAAASAADLKVPAKTKKPAERTPYLEFSFDGSLPLQFTDNVYRLASKTSDVLTSPYLKLSASGELVPHLHYSLYASGGFDKFAVVQDSDGTLATLGASLTRRWGDFRLGGSFERSHAYDGVFGPFLYNANDVSIYARYNFRIPSQNLQIKPGISISTRLTDDPPSANRLLYNARVEFERKLPGRWWFIVTPRVRYYNYSDAQNAGRRDTIASISAGLRYEINKDVSLSAGLGYEARKSNVPGKDFNNFTAGASIDFSHIFERLRWNN
jgi:hypothetical protein